MSEEPDPLAKLSASIADGEAIDWDAVRNAAPDETIRKLLDHLRVVAGIAEVHRSQLDESGKDEPAPSLHAPSATSGQPRRWGHLLLVRKIGEGVFGEVYEALDTWLDHPRALKLLRPEVARRSSAPQLLHEARKLVRVRHPNVVMVHGADKHDGRVGFWMDLVEGQTLEERVKEGRLSAGEALHVGAEVCSALAAVHQAKLLHRDVKAQNVMRASDGGRIILMDFGAGEFLDAPNDGRPQGTPLYLAPEIFKGGPATVQTDVYALGVLLYYLVTARFPVEGRTFADLAAAHEQRRRRFLRDDRPDLPDTFVRIVERAINPDPARRFPSAGDFYRAISEQQPPNVPAPQPAPAAASTSLQRAGYAILAVVMALAAIEIYGFIAYRTFEASLHVHPDFAAGATEYFRVGREALLPFALYWIVGALIVAVLAGVRRVLPSSVNRVWKGWVRRLDAIPPASVATAIAVAGGVSWAALTWAHWPLFQSIITLHAATSNGMPDVNALRPAFRTQYLSVSQFSAWLSFLLMFAAWRWFPCLEETCDDPSAARRVKWGTIVIAMLIVASAVTPRRIALERFEVVSFNGRPSFVLAANGDELLLHSADAAPAARQRVRRDAPGLVRPGATRQLVDR